MSPTIQLTPLPSTTPDPVSHPTKNFFLQTMGGTTYKKVSLSNQEDFNTKFEAIKNMACTTIFGSDANIAQITTTINFSTGIVILKKDGLEYSILDEKVSKLVQEGLELLKPSLKKERTSIFEGSVNTEKSYKSCFEEFSSISKKTDSFEKAKEMLNPVLSKLPQLKKSNFERKIKVLNEAIKNCLNDEERNSIDYFQLAVAALHTDECGDKTSSYEEIMKTLEDCKDNLLNERAFGIGIKENLTHLFSFNHGFTTQRIENIAKGIEILTETSKTNRIKLAHTYFAELRKEDKVVHELMGVMKAVMKESTISSIETLQKHSDLNLSRFFGKITQILESKNQVN